MDMKLVLNNGISFKNGQKRLSQLKQELSTIEKDSSIFKRKIKSYFKQTLLLEGHAWSMDNQKEKDKILNLFLSNLQDLNLI